MKFSTLLLCVLTLFLSACEKIAILSTPKKQPIPATDQQAAEAKQFFWQTLHHGRHQDIPQANRLLMIAYLKNPNDPKLAAYLGFLHIWKITERNQSQPDPLIPNEIILSKKYFQDALILDPGNPIYEGFLGDTQLVEGQVFHDKREEVRGYFTLQRAIDKWPEFNYFTAGYPMSTLSAQSDRFKEAVNWQWRTLDLCAGTRVNRKNPDFTSYMKRETHQGTQRVCWDLWAAPHNFEGFFMNMGDMLVKSGDWQTGIKLYQNAKLAKNYATWPYRQMLEERIINAKQNVAYFQSNNSEPSQSILFNSGHGCMACHQM